MSYDFGCALEIFNPELVDEIAIIKDCITLLELKEGKLKAIEFKHK